MLLGVGRSDPTDHFAFFGRTGDDGNATRFRRFKRLALFIKPKVSLARTIIRAVAFIAVFAEDRTDIAIKINFALSWGDGRGGISAKGQQIEPKTSYSQLLAFTIPPVSHLYHAACD